MPWSGQVGEQELDLVQPAQVHEPVGGGQPDVSGRLRQAECAGPGSQLAGQGHTSLWIDPVDHRLEAVKLRIEGFAEVPAPDSALPRRLVVRHRRVGTAEGVVNPSANLQRDRLGVHVGHGVRRRDGAVGVPQRVVEAQQAELQIRHRHQGGGELRGGRTLGVGDGPLDGLAVAEPALELEALAHVRGVHAAREEPVGVVVEEVERLPHQRQGPVRVSLFVPGLSQQPDQVGLGRVGGVGVRHLVEEPEGAVEVGDGLGAAIGVGHQPSAHRRRVGSRQVVRGVPVVGEPAEVGDPRRLAEPLLQGCCQHAVGAGALTGQQVVVDRLAQQPVAELQVLTDRAQDVGVHRLPQAGLEAVVVVGGDLAEQLVVEPAAVDRGHPQQVARRLGQRVDTGQEEVAQRFREPLDADLQQLLGVQRVALGARQERTHQRRVGPSGAALDDAG